MVALKGQMHCDIRKHEQMENVAKTHKNQVQLHKTQQKKEKKKQNLTKHMQVWGFLISLKTFYLFF